MHHVFNVCVIEIWLGGIVHEQQHQNPYHQGNHLFLVEKLQAEMVHWICIEKQMGGIMHRPQMQNHQGNKLFVVEKLQAECVHKHPQPNPSHLVNNWFVMENLLVEHVPPLFKHSQDGGRLHNPPLKLKNRWKTHLLQKGLPCSVVMHLE